MQDIDGEQHAAQQHQHRLQQFLPMRRPQQVVVADRDQLRGQHHDAGGVAEEPLHQGDGERRAACRHRQPGHQQRAEGRGHARRQDQPDEETRDPVQVGGAPAEQGIGQGKAGDFEHVAEAVDQALDRVPQQRHRGAFRGQRRHQVARQQRLARACDEDEQQRGATAHHRVAMAEIRGDDGEDRGGEHRGEGAGQREQRGMIERTLVPEQRRVAAIEL